MDKPKPLTFAYLLLVLPAAGATKQLAGWSAGDVLEGFIDCEEQSGCASNPWPFDWDRSMARIAAVQFTLGWDPRPTLIDLITQAGFGPKFEIADDYGEGRMIFFETSQDAPHVPVRYPLETHSTTDRERCAAIVQATLDLAREKGWGVLLIGDQGWSYEIEIPAAVQALLQQAGLLFWTRHV